LRDVRGVLFLSTVDEGQSSRLRDVDLGGSYICFDGNNAHLYNGGFVHTLDRRLVPTGTPARFCSNVFVLSVLAEWAGGEDVESDTEERLD